MYSHTNMNKISINHSTREKGCTICHVKRRSISTDFVLISTLNGNWYVSYWLITLAIDGRLVLCYISKRKHKVFVLFREATTHGGSIVSFSIFYFFISFLIFDAVSTPIFPFFALTRNYSGKKRREVKEVRKHIADTKCIRVLCWDEDHTRTISPRSRNVSFLKTRRKGTIYFSSFFTASSGISVYPSVCLLVSGMRRTFPSRNIKIVHIAKFHLI